MTFATVGSPSTAVSGNTMSVTTTNVGDFVLVGWQVATGGGQIVGATSSNAIWAVLCPARLTAGNQYGGVLIGYVVAPGTATVTFNVSGTVSSLQAQAQEFSTSVGLQSLRLDTQMVVPSVSGNLNFPSLNPSHGPGELYFCYSANTGAYTAGSTPGFSYSIAGGNALVWNPACTAAQQSPTAATSSGVGWGVGILLWEEYGQTVGGGFVPDQVATPVSSNGATGTVVVTWPIAPTPGSKVLINISESGASNILSAVDNGTTPTNFNVDNFAFSGAQHCFLIRGDGITLPLKGPYQVTITFTATAFASCFGASWLGLAPGGPVAGSGGTFNSGPTQPVVSNSVTPPGPGYLLLGGFNTSSGNNPTTSYITSPGWVSLGSQVNGNSFQCGAAAYATSVSTAAVTANWTYNTNAFGWQSILSCYAPAKNTIQNNVGLASEMQLGGTWQDVSTWVHQRDAVTISRGRQNEAAGMQAGNNTETLKNQDGRFTLRNPSGAFYPNLLQNVPIRASIPTYYGGYPSYLRMQTDTLGGLQIPDVAAISINAYTPGTVFASAVTTANQTIPATSQGSTLIAIVAYGNAGWTQNITSVTCSGGSSTATFNKVSANQSFDSYISMWELPNCPPNTTTVTANFSAACHGIIRVYEVRGLDPAGAFDRLSSAGNTGSPASSGAAGPTNQGPGIVIGAISAQATAITGTGVGFTNHAASANWFVGDGNGDIAIDGYQIVSTSSSYTYSATFSGGSNGWTACCATFRANANGIGNNVSEQSGANGIMSVRVDCKITDWQHNHVLAAKYGSIGKSWGLWTNGSGVLTFDVYDGTSDHFMFSSCPVPYFSGRIAIRVDYDITLQTVTFFTAPNMGGPWTQLGTTQFTSATSIAHAYNQPVTIGFGTTNLVGTYGEVYEASLICGAKTYDFENANELNDFSSNGGVLSISTTQHNTGNHSLLLTANGTAGTYIATSFAVAPGSPAGVTAFVFSSRAQNANVNIDWFDSAGNYLSTSGGYSVALAASTWTQLSMPGYNAPAKANSGNMYLSLPAPTNTDLVYVDTFTNNGGVVFDAIVPLGVGSWMDGVGNVWQVEGTAELTNKLYRFHGEWAQSPKSTDETTNDVFIQATSYGINQRLNNANTPLNSPLRRAYKFLPSNLRLVDYWPMEEGTKATSFGSAVGGSPMTIAGNPTLASNSTFVCSAPIPVLNSATFIAPIRTSSVNWQDNITRFLLSVPSSDDTNGGIIAKVYTSGTIAILQLVYGTGGTLNLQGFNAANGLVFQTGNIGFGLAELADCRISMELVENGGSPNYGLWVLTANGTTANGTSGAYAGFVGGVTQVALGNASMVGSAVGHLSVQAVDDGINDLINPMIGWIGEAAATRFARICTEEGLNCRIMGPTEQSQVMGVQPIDTLANILQQCESTDQGQQYEPRDALALGYRTIRGLYNQPVMSRAGFVAADLFTGFGSTADTQLTVNDVTANAADGSTARQTMTSGFPNLSKMNTNSPNSGWPPTFGTVTSPTAFEPIATTPPIAAGTYNVKWAINISGTLSSNETNNFRLYLLNAAGVALQLLATSVNGFGANLYNQADALNVVVPAGGAYLGIYSGSNAGTSGAVYGGTIFGQDAGIGSVQTSTSPNPASDTELNSSANWTLHVRSIDDDRYPLLPFHIARLETPQSVFLLDIGDFLQVPDTPVWLPNGGIKQLAAGFQETYYPGAHGIIEINGIPELPYEVALVASGAQRLASAGSFLSLGYTYGNTSLSVAPYPGSLTTWTVNPSDFPLNIVMAGMVLQVTNITGGFGIQTFTVGATSLNGVVKNLPIGTPVQVASPMVVAW